MLTSPVRTSAADPVTNRISNVIGAMCGKSYPHFSETSVINRPLFDLKGLKENLILKEIVENQVSNSTASWMWN